MDDPDQPSPPLFSNMGKFSYSVTTQSELDRLEEMIKEIQTESAKEQAKTGEAPDSAYVRISENVFTIGSHIMKAERARKEADVKPTASRF